MLPEVAGCCTDVTRSERFSEKSISKVSAVEIEALLASERGRNHGYIEERAMVTQIVRASSPVLAQGRFAGRVRRRPERARSAGCSVERLEALDAELARRVGEAGRLRFEMGRGLDLLEQSGGDHALGFSSIEAYALERCERSASWTQKARGLARRLERLPVIEDALISGSLTWSMAAVLATVASPDDAEFWLAEAARRTVREMKALVVERRGAVDKVESLEAEEELRTLTLTVSREDAWCFEQAKLLGRHLGEGTHADVVFGLVAESTSTLCSELQSGAIELADDNSMDAQRAWEGELARMRTEAEARCESHFRRGREPRLHTERLHWPQSPEAIDRQLRELAQELALREVALGRALDTFFSADGWRRLGYATAAQYARERLGTSLSSIKAKRWLVKRLGELRFLADALDRGELGYEAARLVARVATRATVEAWVTRATERTLRHLCEEIDAAELLARWSDSATALPPSDADVRRVEDLERAVVTGKMSAPPVPPSRASAPPANVTLRLRVHASTARDFRHWEAIYLRHRGSALSTTTFLRFACELFIDTWCPQRAEVEYAQIYQRDRYRCQSPCCGRRDVTPHHLRFRSHGGDDSPENVTSLCTWCHLEGIHRGHISARPPASSIRWTYGRGAHTVVEGRRRVRAEPSVDRRA
jgi:hypothetical protein